MSLQDGQEDTAEFNSTTYVPSDAPRTLLRPDDLTQLSRGSRSPLPQGRTPLMAAGLVGRLHASIIVLGCRGTAMFV